MTEKHLLHIRSNILDADDHSVMQSGVMDEVRRVLLKRLEECRDQARRAVAAKALLDEEISKLNTLLGAIDELEPKKLPPTKASNGKLIVSVLGEFGRPLTRKEIFAGVRSKPGAHSSDAALRVALWRLVKDGPVVHRADDTFKLT